MESKINTSTEVTYQRVQLLTEHVDWHDINTGYVNFKEQRDYVRTAKILTK